MAGLAGAAAVGAVTALAVNRLAGPAPTGVVQGSPLSPLMANVYLHPFDCWMMKRGHRLVRYADDFVVLAESETRAEAGYNDTIQAMHKLRLRMNRQKMRIVRPGEAWEFLGETIR
jgi:retron-type reverse transcriptase